MGMWSKAAWTMVAAAPLMAQAQVDLTKLDRDMVGPRSQVMVLGTVHLSGMPASFNASSLGGVIDKLAAFKPDIITIEREPGEDCDLAQRHPAKYGPDWCPKTDAAKAATGLDIPAALAEVDKTLKAWPAKPAHAQRRRLAAAFLAANEPASALVQWLQLPAAERRSGDSLDAALVAMLEKLEKRKNEDNLIAAPLAARLGLQRVYAVDNHTGDRIDVPDIKAFVKTIEAAWASGSQEAKEHQKREDDLSLAEDMLPLYRYVNSPESARIHAESNVLPMMRTKSPEGYPQIWVGGWEIRNLRMVANIRETFRERPGARVLTIVGASHKPWFDQWLGQLQGVEIVDAVQVLK
ncbi:DUF5694 domain-containing protein [Pseudoduganella violaceinigra]|uniref:DUF5694 domain-containing protein n=1 Tax=Pseudoduganella violaceinigra TaxID=246602 RepID=UPI001B7FA80C|nr:DUF5694 domain-containing protein [Pseudoduganella violaceinigra]